MHKVAKANHEFVMRKHGISASAALVALFAAAWLGASCSSDTAQADPDTGDVTSGDATNDVVPDESGPDDEAEAVEVEVPVAPRAFRMATGVPIGVRASDALDAAWSAASEDSDGVLIWLDNGLPWAELLAGERFPDAYDAFLDDLEQRILATGGDTVVVIDLFNPSRDGFVRDVLGRPTDDLAIGFDQANFAARYADFCATLASRLRPRAVAPMVDVNLYAAATPEQQAAMIQAYVAARIAVQDVDPQIRVFPLWDIDMLRETAASNDAEGRPLIRQLDERLDVFAFQLRPADSLTPASELSPGDLDFARSLTTRPLGVVGTAYPSTGFVRGADVFASSENSQYNFLAYILAEGERLGLNQVAWRMATDPNTLLQDPCGDLTVCDEADVTRRYDGLRSTGLRGAAGTSRRALTLWNDYRARPPIN